jgi:hypothetical protein
MTSGLILVLALWAPPEEKWRLALRGDNASYSVRPDGSDRKKLAQASEPLAQEAEDPRWQNPRTTKPQVFPSPDGKRLLRTEDDHVVVLDADGKNPHKITAGQAAGWSPDGKRIVLLQHAKDRTQVFCCDADGAGLHQASGATDAHACMPRFLPDGRIVWLENYTRRTTIPPSNLVISDGKAIRKLVAETWVSDFACSPDGKTLACGKLGKLEFIDVATGKTRATVPLIEIDAELAGHAAHKIRWRPDGKAVACALGYQGGYLDGARDATGNFAGTEVFVIPLEGRPTWFLVEKSWNSIAWEKETSSPPAGD